MTFIMFTYTLAQCDHHPNHLPYLESTSSHNSLVVYNSDCPLCPLFDHLILLRFSRHVCGDYELVGRTQGE